VRVVFVLMKMIEVEGKRKREGEERRGEVGGDDVN